MKLARLALIYVILLLLALGVLLYGVLLPRLISAPSDASVITGAGVLLALTPVWLFALAWAFRLLATLEKPTQKP